MRWPWGICDKLVPPQGPHSNINLVAWMRESAARLGALPVAAPLATHTRTRAFSLLSRPNTQTLTQNVALCVKVPSPAQVVEWGETSWEKAVAEVR